MNISYTRPISISRLPNHEAKGKGACHSLHSTCKTKDPRQRRKQQIVSMPMYNKSLGQHTCINTSRHPRYSPNTSMASICPGRAPLATTTSSTSPSASASASTRARGKNGSTTSASASSRSCSSSWLMGVWVSLTTSHLSPYDSSVYGRQANGHSISSEVRGGKMEGQNARFHAFS